MNNARKGVLHTAEADVKFERMGKMKQVNVYTIKMVKESGKRYDLDHKKIREPKDVANVIQTVLDLNSEAVEKFGILTVNTKHEVAGVHVISMGSLSASIVHPREVFKPAILNNSSGIVLFHNHPSGDPTPSKEDIAITKRLIEAGKLLGINVLDHIIVGQDEIYNSFRETTDIEF